MIMNYSVSRRKKSFQSCVRYYFLKMQGSIFEHLCTTDSESNFTRFCQSAGKVLYWAIIPTCRACVICIDIHKLHANNELKHRLVADSPATSIPHLAMVSPSWVCTYQPASRRILVHLAKLGHHFIYIFSVLFQCGDNPGTSISLWYLC